MKLRPDSASVYNAIGIPITFDTRDNVSNPSTGWYSNARINRFDEALGSATGTPIGSCASHYFHKKPVTYSLIRLPSIQR
ncbi:MAG: hypothetical protein IPJ20_11445 [Flammeovirgaceae bacterium]|nr:hypothetical protein [Flammeovirgaceae bacterium]